MIRRISGAFHRFYKRERRIGLKVYQLIYTSVQHSLSDQELGLENQSGMRVWSCSQGLTQNNISEVIKFSTYRLPKNNDVPFSEIIGDPTIPGLFPKIFRTLHLSDGRYAAIQSVFAGVDHQGQPRNYFAHALIFDEFSDDFMPELYCGHEIFKTCLTTEEAEGELVSYLPVLEDLEPEESAERELKIFIDLHRAEMSYLIGQALVVLGSDTITHLCISTDNEFLTRSYCLALKYMLPRELDYHMGVSTYNVYIPSDKQNQIIFNGTIKGKNNITKQAIETRTNCLFIDMEKLEVMDSELSPLFNFSLDELRKEYTKYNFTSAQQLDDWLATHDEETKPGMGAKLLKLKQSGGNEIFAKRATELYKKLENDDMKPVRFEICKVMFDNSPLFHENLKSITDNYISMCLARLCHGVDYDIEDFLPQGPDTKSQAQFFKNRMADYMETIRANFDTIGDKNKYLLLSLFAQIKHETEDDSWHAFFKERKQYLTTFTELASMIITGFGAHAFSPPSNWTPDELHEVIAYFDSSTQDDTIKQSCLKYVYFHENVDWAKYGILPTKHKKTRGEEIADIRKVKRMLAKVGYIPFGKTSYTDIKADVNSDVFDSTSPLLLSRLLYAYYQWRSTYGNQAAARKKAERVRALLLEMKRTQTSCYNYVLPKLALEIIDTPGHYHETMVNTDTMPLSFWNWFLIAYSRIKNDDDKLLNYTRVYMASRKGFMKQKALWKRMKMAFKEAAAQ